MRFFLFIFLILSVFGKVESAYCTVSDGVKADLAFESFCMSADSDKIKAAVKFTIPGGMHTYWKFAGQTGEPTEISLSAYPAAEFSDIEWQTPQIYDNMGFYEIIYLQKAWHFFDVMFPSKLADMTDTTDKIRVNAKVTFLQCGNLCEPRQIDLSAELSVCELPNNQRYSLEFKNEYRLVASPQKEQEILSEYHRLADDENTAENNNKTADEPKDTKGAFDNDSLLYIILLAFLGGILLNFMPCVLPVVSIKLLSLAKARDKSIKKDSLWYGLGIVFSFLAVWLFICLIRAGGETIGWGFQLQNPPFVLFLFVLLLVLALVFSGFITVPPQLTRFVNNEQSAFSSGVLAVFLASPCVAPFMGTAVAYALAIGGLNAFCVFLFLGLGLAFPFVFFAFFKGWIKYLPKTSSFNVVLERVLSVPLYISALWLLDVIYAQTGCNGLVSAICSAIAVVAAVVLRRRVLWLFLAMFFVISLVFVSYSDKLHEPPAKKLIDWQEYSAEALTLAISSGKPAFVDFTAKWCLTCMANEHLVLERQATAALFADHNIALFKADFTLKDDTIMAALQKYGSNGVPLYVYYPQSSGDKPVKPVVLPQILTFDRLEQAVKEGK